LAGIFHLLLETYDGFIPFSNTALSLLNTDYGLEPSRLNVDGNETGTLCENAYQNRYSKKEIIMSAYIMAFVRTKDLEGYNREYAPLAFPLVMKHGGQPVAMTENVETLEGAVPAGRLAILEFPSLENAKAFYADPEYQSLIKVRQKYSESDAVIFDKGFDPSAL